MPVTSQDLKRIYLEAALGALAPLNESPEQRDARARVMEESRRMRAAGEGLSLGIDLTDLPAPPTGRKARSRG